MNFINEELRICPHCKSKINISKEPKVECPKCKKVAWFYNYRELKELPPPEPLPPIDFWSNPTTILLLVVLCILCLIAIGTYNQNFILAAVCTLLAITASVFAFIKHTEVLKVEQSLKDSQRIYATNETLKSRLKDAISRFNHLLAVGNRRVEIYQQDVLNAAIKEKQLASQFRDQARIDREAISSVDERIRAMAKRLVDDHIKGITKKLRPDPESYQQRKLELTKTFDFVKSVGYEVPKDISKASLENLKQAYKEVVRQQFLKDEQKRINQQMREEAKLQREAERSIKETQDKEQEIQNRLDQALRTRQNEFDSEIENLRRQLAEAHEKSIRALSMAQQTKAGHVYILSNIGSFGENIYKVGMTRRMDPQDRVDELGDASVPFPFDVHAMISCENAPQLENMLHRELARYRVNRINLRKEYFRVDLNKILGVVKKSYNSEIEYVATPEALQYRQSLEVSPEEVVELEKDMEEMGLSTDDQDE